MQDRSFEDLLAQIKQGNIPSPSEQCDSGNGIKIINEGLEISQYSEHKAGIIFRGDTKSTDK